MTRNPFLSDQLLADQFSRDSQCSPRRMRQPLRTPELGIRGADRASRRKYRPVAFKHYKTGILVGQPAERCKGDHSVRANHDQSL
jgi:hypothetical protein